VVALSPIRHRVDPSLAPEIHGLFLKEDPEALALLAQEASRITEGRYDLEARPLGDEDVGVILTGPRTAAQDIGALEDVRLPEGFAGKPLIEVLLMLAARRQAIPREIGEADAALSRIASAFAPSLAAAERQARATLGRLRALGLCGTTLARAGRAYSPQRHDVLLAPLPVGDPLDLADHLRPALPGAGLDLLRQEGPEPLVVPLEDEELPAPLHGAARAVARAQPLRGDDEQVEALAPLEPERPHLEHQGDRELVGVVRDEGGEVVDLVAPERLEACAHVGLRPTP
jgi:hypothetical protein